MTDRTQESVRADGRPACIIFERDGEKSDQEHYDHVVETDYSYLCNKADLSVVDEWRKHSVMGVRWL